MPTPLVSRLSLEKENTPSNRRATEGGREEPGSEPLSWAGYCTPRGLGFPSVNWSDEEEMGEQTPGPPPAESLERPRARAGRREHRWAGVPCRAVSRAQLRAAGTARTLGWG